MMQAHAPERAKAGSNGIKALRHDLYGLSQQAGLADGQLSNKGQGPATQQVCQGLCEQLCRSEYDVV